MVKKNRALPDLNGLSIDSMTINQDGELSVTFDLPVDQRSEGYQLGLQGTRTLDIYDFKEIQKLCRDLFRVVRREVEKPDPDREGISCGECKSSSCCRKYNVLVTQYDIDRLCTGLDLTREQMDRRLVAAVDWCEDYKFQLTCDEDDDGEKCVFLKPNEDGQMRCSIYEHRPQICRDFDEATCDDFVPMEEVEIL